VKDDLNATGLQLRRRYDRTSKINTNNSSQNSISTLVNMNRF